MEFSSVAGGNAGNGAGMVERLEAAGFDVKSALHYCAEDSDFYREVLEEHAQDADEKIAGLDGFFREKDWKEYQVLVHSMKSSARTVGGSRVSEEAKALEDAAGQGDAAFIEAHHSEFLLHYGEHIRIVREAIVAA